MTTKLDDSGVMFADGTYMTSAKNLGMRNRLINGNFGINQRVVSGTVVLAAGAYGHDRWKAGASGCTYTFATSNNVTTITISAGSLQQVVEGLNLQSGTHVLSWAGTAQGRIDGGTYGASGAVTATAVGGTNMTVEFNTGTVSLAQLEEGSLASRFEQRHFATELTLCQRYFEKSYDLSVGLGSPGGNGIIGWGHTSATATNVVARGQVFFKAHKRATPTVTVYSNASGNASVVFSNGATADVAANVTVTGETGFFMEPGTGVATTNQYFSCQYAASAEL